MQPCILYYPMLIQGFFLQCVFKFFINIFPSSHTYNNTKSTLIGLATLEIGNLRYSKFNLWHIFDIIMQD